MATCMVYHNNPNDGPGLFSAQVALASFQQAQPTWNITMNHKTESTTYTATPNGGVTVTGDNLEALVEPAFRGFGYLFASAD